MDDSRIAALLEPFLDRRLAPLQLAQISMYIDLLLRWNARINLTAIRTPEEIVTRHFGESFFLARHLFPDPPAMEIVSSGHTEQIPTSAELPPAASRQAPAPAGVRVIDLGSGAGFPAVPLRLWTSYIRLTLIESNHKKAAFLREVVRALTLTNIDVIADRAEAISRRLGPEFPHADVVTFRAVEKFDQVLPLAVSFLAPKGRLALLTGSAQLPKLRSRTTLTWRSTPIPHSDNRILSIGE